MSTWQRRTAGVLVAAVGAAFIIVVMVDRLFSVGPAFERMSDGFRPIMKPAPIAQLQNDLKGLDAVGAEFGTKAVPMLSQAMNLTPEQFSAFMAQRYPAVATGMKELPGTVTQFQGVVQTLAAEQARFAQADAIPASNLPATTVPWGLLAAGMILLGLGILMAVRPVPLWPAVAAVVGGLLIVVPLTLSLTTKASAADTMNKHLQPVYTAKMLNGAKGALVTVGTMGQQMQTEMLPALGQQLGMTPEQLQAFFAQNLPATGAALSAMPQALTRFEGVLKAFQAHLADYNTLKPIAFVPIVWIMVGGGILTLIAGVGGLFTGRRIRDIEEVAPAQLRAA
jgi:hypothetical protein